MYKIAICDDDKRFGNIIEDYIQQYIKQTSELDNCEITHFTRAEDLLKQKNDLVFADMELPGMSGIELAAEYKRSGSPTRVILVSGYPEIMYSKWTEYAFAYLEKPVLYNDLCDALDNVLNDV